MKIDKSRKKNPPLPKSSKQRRSVPNKQRYKSKYTKSTIFISQKVEESRKDDVEQRKDDVGKIIEIDVGEESKVVEKPPEPSWRDLFDEALVLYQQGVNGDTAAVSKTLELLERIRTMVPENDLVKAYYGATLVLTGRDAPTSTDRFRNVQRGLKIIDEAVASAPSEPEIRLLRGFVNQRLPELYFHRTAMAAEDFAYLAEEYERDSSILPQDLYWRTLYEWGAACKKLELYPLAQKAWKKLLEDTTDDRYKELLKREKKVLNREYKDESDETKPKEQWKKRWERELPKEGLECYEKALDGDKDAAFNAFEIFSQAYEKNRRNPLVQAYYADCLSLTGKYQSEVPDMIGTTIKAMKIYDNLVYEYPENVRIRLMRAYHSFRLPETFFHRTVTAIDDFNVLMERYNADSSVLPEQAYWQILFDLGSAYLRTGMKEEAQETWEILVEQCPDPQYREWVEMQPTEKIPDYSQLSKEELFEEGKRLHALGVAGNRRAAILARECWRTAYDAYPGDILAQAYYGSSLALSARDAVEPEQIFRTTYQGLNLLNEAVDLAPEDTEVRMLRAYVLNALPRPFFPSHMAKEDFKILKDAYERDNTVFSQEQFDRIVAALNSADEREGHPLAGLEVRISPLIKKLLAGKVISENE